MVVSKDINIDVVIEKASTTCVYWEEAIKSNCNKIQTTLCTVFLCIRGSSKRCRPPLILIYLRYNLVVFYCSFFVFTPERGRVSYFNKKHRFSL